METWVWIIGVVVVGVVILKFILKPLFKLVAFAALGLLVWWYFGDQITAWLSLMN